MQGISQKSRLRLKKIGSTKQLRVGNWNVGSMTGKGREIVDIMQRRKIDIMCVQETKWKGDRSKELGEGYKIIHNGTETRRNKIRVIVNEEMKANVMEVKRSSGRCMMVKIVTGEGILNVVSAYARRKKRTVSMKKWE